LAKLADPIYDIVNGLDAHRTDDLYNMYLGLYTKDFLDEEQERALHVAIDETRKIPHEEPKPRKRLQYFGTEGARAIDQDIWVKIYLARIRINPEIKYVTDDVRFRNELETVKKEDFLVIKLEVDPSVQEERIKRLYGEFDPKILAHASELEIGGLKGDITVDANQPLKKMLIEINLYMINH
jgi:hypothetical protein